MIVNLGDFSANFLMGLLYATLVVSIWRVLRERNGWVFSQCVLVCSIIGLLHALMAHAGKHGSLLGNVIASVMEIDKQVILALAAGVLCGLSLLRWSDGTSLPSRRPVLCVLGLLGVNAFLALLALMVFMPQVLQGSQVKDSRYRVEPIWSFEDEPICICMDDRDHVYVSTEHFLDGREEGKITRIARNESGKWNAVTTLGAQGLLNRPFGMTWHEGSLFVARSGRLVHATPTGLVYAETGAITQCRDLDENGVFEQFVDVVDQLPGYGGPTPQHGLNGVQFDRERNMYISVGNPTERGLEQKPLEGKVLRYRPGSRTPEIFARGFRNAFGFHMNARDELFVTDNDVESNPGDELIHVVEGGHYGHPYVIPGESEGADPRFKNGMYVGNKRGNLVGLTYADGDAFPEDLRDTLFVADNVREVVLAFKLDRSGDVLKVGPEKVFAKFVQPIGIAAARDGSLYVITRRPDNRLYRISRE